MMMNLFSIFDPSIVFFNPFFIVFFFVLMILFFFGNNKGFYFFKKFNNFLFGIFSEGKSDVLFFFNFLVSLSFVILVLNLFGLFMYSWCSSAHLSNNVPIVFMFIFIIVLKIFFFKKKVFFIHLIPLGTPFLLIPFMFLIEVISWLIRPVTLILRLTANLISGHILIHLVFSISFFFDFKVYKFISVFLISPFIFLEIMVSVVQALIISYLIGLYMKEI